MDEVSARRKRPFVKGERYTPCGFGSVDPYSTLTRCRRDVHPRDPGHSRGAVKVSVLE